MDIVSTYFAYLTISLAVTIWVARTLHKNGRIFLIDAFHSNTELADSVNHLLLVGFYLVNIGYVTLALRTSVKVASLREAIELLSDKIGMVLVVLGVMHFSNLYIFSRIRKRTQERVEQPLFPPDTFVSPAPRG
jgi:hypothetical protein